MSEWRLRSLAELTENLDSRRVPIKEADRRTGSYPYYGASGIVDYVDDFLFDGLHLLIAEDGENLRTRKLPIAFLANGRFWVNNHAHIVKANAEADTRFLLYALLTADVTSYLSGSTMPKLTQGNLNRIPILAPPKEEQQAIAAVLGALDDKIDVNRRTNKTLESIARAIFKDWFVDFGPTRAKQEGRTPYLAPDLWSLFPDRLDAEGKPAGWERIALREAADVFSGGTPAKDNLEFWNGTIPWISPKVMTDIHVTTSDDRVTEQAIGRGTRMVPSGSVLLMVRGMGLHEGVRISQACCDVTFNQDVKALVGKRLSGTHLLFGLLDAAQYLFSKVEASGHGTGKLPTETIEAICFVTPTGDSYLKLIGPLDALNDRIAANNAESKTLSALRNLLLPRLISGDVRVKADETTFGAPT
jgi:type I restriction enzyme S subunit